MAAINAIARIERDLDEAGSPNDHLADPILQELKNAANQDQEYQALLAHLRSTPVALPDQLRVYKHAISELSISPEDLILYRQRLLVPRSFRREVLKRLHASHQGITRTLRRARQAVYWPGITNDVTNTVEACDACQKHLPSLPKEPLLYDPPPTRVFEELAADFFETGGKHYLAMVDRHSGYPLVTAFSSAPNAAATIDRLKHAFTTFGCPTRLFSDGGRQFTAQETQEFLQRWGVKHRLSTAHYPQSNGLAESAVKALKTLLSKTGGRFNSEEFDEGLLELRNTPRKAGKSPAEIVFGHPLRSRLPTHHTAFDKRWLVAMEDYDKKASELQAHLKADYDVRAHELPRLAIGATVRLQDPVSKLWDKTAIILSRGRHRDYRVRLPSGRCYWRNRRYLRPAHKPDLAEDSDGEATSTPGDECPMSAPSAPEEQKTPRRSKRVRMAPTRLSY